MAVMTEGVQATARDLQVLRFAGEMYGVPLELFGRLYEWYGERELTASSRATLGRGHAARLEALGFAGRHRRLGRRWVFLTGRGMREAGLPFAPDEPELWKLEHVETVARLRLHLEAAYPGSRWESERCIKRRYRQEHLRGRIPDGLLELPSGAQVAIEVELSRKRRNRYPDLFGTPESWDATWWFARNPVEAAWLRERMAEAILPLKPRHEIGVLPEGVSRP